MKNETSGFQFIRFSARVPVYLLKGVYYMIKIKIWQKQPKSIPYFSESIQDCLSPKPEKADAWKSRLRWLWLPEEADQDLKSCTL